MFALELNSLHQSPSLPVNHYIHSTLRLSQSLNLFINQLSAPSHSQWRPSVRIEMVSGQRATVLRYACTSYLVHYEMRYSRNKSAQQNPCLEANSCWGNHKIPLDLWNPKFTTMLTNIPPEIPFLSQMNPVHNLASYFLKISFNIIRPPKLHLSSGLLLAVYPTKTWSAPSSIWSSFHIRTVSAVGPSGGITIWRLYSVTLSNQAQLILQVIVSLSVLA